MVEGFCGPWVAAVDIAVDAPEQLVFVCKDIGGLELNVRIAHWSLIERRVYFDTSWYVNLQNMSIKVFTVLFAGLTLLYL